MREPTLEDLVHLSARELDRAMREGRPVDLEVLADRLYEGVSLNLPAAIERLTWTKFAKVFERTPDGSLRGWNCKIDQTPLDQPWTLTLRDGRPMTYGHYRVRPAADYRMPRPYGAGGVVLDYGLGGNPALDFSGRVRDPLVALDDKSELLLGWSYVDLGLFSSGTPSFFGLRRGPPLTHSAPPP